MGVSDRRRSRAPRLAPGARRTAIVAAAVRAAGRRSLAAVSVADVAHEAGVSKAAIFKYFPDRSALVDAILDEVERFYFGLQERARTGSDDPVRILVNLSLAYAASLETHFDHAKIVLGWSALVDQPRVVARLGRIFLGYVALVEDMIREGIRRRSISADIDVDLAAWTFVGYSSTIGAARFFGRPPEWIVHLQIALLRNLLGHRAVDRVIAGTRPSALTAPPDSPTVPGRAGRSDLPPHR